MSYQPDVTAALSGATVRQLSYWRSERTHEPLLAPEHRQPRARVFYSFPDVVALRAFVYLRSQAVPLQRVRKAVTALRAMGATDHLSRYTLVASGGDVVWQVSSEDAIDLTGKPGQHVIAAMVDILGAFRNMQDQGVVPLYRPTPGVSVDPDVLGGYPVIEGTRVPYDVVAGLLDDGLPPENVRAFYPSVEAEAARGAVAFARYVDEYRGASAAA